MDQIIYTILGILAAVLITIIVQMAVEDFRWNTAKKTGSLVWFRYRLPEGVHNIPVRADFRSEKGWELFLILMETGDLHGYPRNSTLLWHGKTDIKIPLLLCGETIEPTVLFNLHPNKVPPKVDTFIVAHR